MQSLRTVFSYPARGYRALPLPGFQTDEALHCDLLRDAFEFPLAKAFLDRKKPILAICRGFQLLNVALGGTLVQHIPDWCKTDHSGGVSHPVVVQGTAFFRPARGIASCQQLPPSGGQRGPSGQGASSERVLEGRHRDHHRGF
jgi:putative intracellular protease/amidase